MPSFHYHLITCARGIILAFNIFLLGDSLALDGHLIPYKGALTFFDSLGDVLPQVNHQTFPKYINANAFREETEYQSPGLTDSDPMLEHQPSSIYRQDTSSLVITKAHGLPGPTLFELLNPITVIFFPLDSLTPC